MNERTNGHMKASNDSVQEVHVYLVSRAEQNNAAATASPFSVKWMAPSDPGTRMHY